VTPSERGALRLSIFSRFFRNTDERKFEQIADRARSDATRQLGPLNDIGLAIVRAATNCRDGVGSFVESKGQEERDKSQMFAFFEFMYFFMHLTMRAATTVMTEPEIKVLQRHLGPFMASVAVRSYFDHWPEDMKTKMTRSFYDDLNDAEIDYAKCSVFDSPLPAGGRAEEIAMRLFNRVGKRVSSILDSGPLSPPLIARVAIDEWAKLNPATLIQDFKRHSMSLPDIPQAGGAKTIDDLEPAIQQQLKDAMRQFDRMDRRRGKG
jgi:hypothetical protein